MKCKCSEVELVKELPKGVTHDCGYVKRRSAYAGNVQKDLLQDILDKKVGMAEYDREFSRRMEHFNS